MGKEIFFKVYQDKNSIDTFYVETKENIEESLPHWVEIAAESDDGLFPVIEPVLMTQQEFEALPEFQGY